MPIFLNVTDEFGRTYRPSNRPNRAPVFVSRVEDRTSGLLGPIGPEEIANALRAAEDGDMQNQADLFQQMEEKDGALAGFMQTRRLAPSGLDWAIVPSVDSPRAKRAAEICDEVVRNIPGFRWALIDLCDAIGKGISAMEIDWSKSADVIGLRHINPKRYRFDFKSDRFLIAPNDYKDPVNDGIEPEPFKVIVHRSKMRSGHPARGGILRVVTWAYLLRNYTFKDWITFSEIFGMPLRVGKYPIGAGDDEKLDLLNALKALGTDAAAIISDDTEIQYREAVNRGNQPYSVLADTMRSEMALAILGQELTNTVGPDGSRAQAEVHNEVRYDLLKADCQDLQETIKRQLLFPIVGWKLGWGVAEKLCPVFKLHYEAPKDHKKQAEIDKLVFIDMKLGKHVTIGYIAQRYGIQLAEDADPQERLIGADGEVVPGVFPTPVEEELDRVAPEE